MIGGFYFSALVAELFFGEPNVSRHGGLLLFSLLATVLAGVLAFWLPYQRQFVVRLKKTDAANSGQGERVELIFGEKKQD